MMPKEIDKALDDLSHSSIQLSAMIRDYLEKVEMGMETACCKVIDGELHLPFWSKGQINMMTADDWRDVMMSKGGARKGRGRRKKKIDNGTIPANTQDPEYTDPDSGTPIPLGS
jgi:hypothetical protein